MFNNLIVVPRIILGSEERLHFVGIIRLFSFIFLRFFFIPNDIFHCIYIYINKQIVGEHKKSENFIYTIREVMRNAGCSVVIITHNLVRNLGSLRSVAFRLHYNIYILSEWENIFKPNICMFNRKIVTFS